MQTALVDARTLSKLRWRCRRGLLENDLLIERFFARHGATLTEAQAEGLMALMELDDNDLLDLLLRRREADAALAARTDAMAVLRLMRAPAPLAA
jgi:antitoxin CptB